MLAIRMESFKESSSFGVREPDRVIVEISILLHVVNVCPDCFQRDAELGVIVHD